VAYFKVESRYLPVENERNHEKLVRVAGLFTEHHLSLLLLLFITVAADTTTATSITTATTISTLHNKFMNNGCSYFLELNIYTVGFEFLTAVSIIAVMMEAARTYVTLVIFYQTTRRYNPEDSHLRTHRRDNLKSY
jgi:hypothetical protein